MILNQSPYPDVDPYEVLGVPRDADRKTVAKANREKMKQINRTDPQYQQCQEAKETLTKPAKRLRVDLRTFSSTGGIAELREQYEGRKLEIEVTLTPDVVALFTDLDAKPEADFAAPQFVEPKLKRSDTLGGDPVADRMNLFGV